MGNGTASLQYRSLKPQNTPLATLRTKQKYAASYLSFRSGEGSVKGFDTVTWNKSICCKQMQKLIGSCYTQVTRSHIGRPGPISRRSRAFGGEPYPPQL